MLLVNTDRHVPCARDIAAADQLLDRSLPDGFRSWQQCGLQATLPCAKARGWWRTRQLEFILTAELQSDAGSGAHSIDWRLATRFSSFTCALCRGLPALEDEVADDTGGAAGGGGEGEIEQLCPEHVLACYHMRDSRVRDITKVFRLCCPDCGFTAGGREFATGAQVCQAVAQHVAASRRCSRLAAAWAEGRFSSRHAFGAERQGGLPEAEETVEHALARIVARVALIVAQDTRPPPGIRPAPLPARALSAGEWLRHWAVQSLSSDVDLIEMAGWVRPTLRSLQQGADLGSVHPSLQRIWEQRPSLLDLVCSPPFIAAAENDAGCVGEKLATLLRRYSSQLQRGGGQQQQQQQQQQQRQQQQRQQQRLGQQGRRQQQQQPQASACDLLAQLLRSDPLFAWMPEQERVPALLARAGTSAPVLEATYALVCCSEALQLCADCGLTQQDTTKPLGLQACAHCIVCLCAACRPGSGKAGGRGGSRTPAGPWLCPWCDGRPEVELGEAGATPSLTAKAAEPPSSRSSSSCRVAASPPSDAPGGGLTSAAAAGAPAAAAGAFSGSALARLGLLVQATVRRQVQTLWGSLPQPQQAAQRAGQKRPRAQQEGLPAKQAALESQQQLGSAVGASLLALEQVMPGLPIAAAFLAAVRVQAEQLCAVSSPDGALGSAPAAAKLRALQRVLAAAAAMPSDASRACLATCLMMQPRREASSTLLELHLQACALQDGLEAAAGLSISEASLRALAEACLLAGVAAAHAPDAAEADCARLAGAVLPGSLLVLLWDDAGDEAVQWRLWAAWLATLAARAETARVEATRTGAHSAAAMLVRLADDAVHRRKALQGAAPGASQ